ncbi:MAG: thiamine pyrophosphate-dependent dehydrogenase E1 component subunit alpha [Chloroflexi bacterium]|nr:thiamine pyrophosphate-dependent dehydrogenase E1 component subunit alpha [Chloroflexota bacterium]
MSTLPSAPSINREGLNDDQLRQFYVTMLRIRRFEEKVKELFLDARLYGSVHLYIGEEAVAAGACAALRDGDVISSTHRGHGHGIAKGLELGPMMAELMGKATGYNFGKGGSMHIASLDHGMLGANGIVAAGIPIATGAALGFWIRGSREVALCFFGDGGANHGAFHEGINFAATLKLPAIFLCENNHYAQYQPVTQDLPVSNVADRAAAYGIPGVIVDGADVLAVYAATRRAAERARAGEGPTLIEAKTYRFEGHFLGDPESYRAKEEVAAARTERDPLTRFATLLTQLGLAGAEDFQRYDDAVRQEVAAAVAFAESSPEPSPDLLLTDVYDVDGRA